MKLELLCRQDRDVHFLKNPGLSIFAGMNLKMALLLVPHRLFSDYIIIESLQVKKSDGGIDFEVNELDNSELRKYYAELSKDAKDALVWINKEGMLQMKEGIKKTFNLQRGGLSYEAYQINAMTRQVHELIMRIRPFASQVKWYHKTKMEKGNFKTAPCVFSGFKPQLSFRVEREQDRLVIKTFFAINGQDYDEWQFSRYRFLLESRNEYFLLSWKDYQTLEWLAGDDPSRHAASPEDFSGQVLARLEKDYKVDRNNQFDTTVVTGTPVNRVMLSEISQSFLVLTPQWMYDGLLVEGNWKEKTELVRNGVLYELHRRKEPEAAFVSLLESLHPNFAKQLNGYYYLPFAEAQKKQWFLKVYHRLLEQDIQIVGMDMLHHFRYSPHKPDTRVEITEKEDGRLVLRLSLHFGKEEVVLAELKKLLLAGQKAVLLKDGSMGVLNEDWLRQYGTIMKHGRIKDQLIEVPRWLALNEESATVETQVLRPVLKAAWWKKWEQWQQPETVVYAVPAGVKASLRPYQQKGYEWMRLLAEAGAGACLADDMGLGKTLQTICLLADRIAGRPDQQHLIICPTSLIHNWLQELNKFAPALNCLVYHGPQRDFNAIAGGAGQVVITSYGTLRGDIDQITSLAFGVAVIDESHHIKNPSSQISRAVMQIHADIRVALSGTPVMNNTFDLYAQLEFLLPGMLGSREFFKTEYADPIDRDRDPEKIKALQHLTAPFVLRRTKEQVATDLPEKTESVLWCEMGANQKEAYQSVREKIRNSLSLEIRHKGLNAGKLSVLHGILKLRQVCNSCELVKDEDLFTYDSIKTKILISELRNITAGHKVLVFSQFTQMLDLLQRDLTAAGILTCRLDGSTPMKQRQEIVNRFQEADAAERVFLISLKAGNAGLNLTAADYVFLFDPWWNTAVQQQAIDRTHRIGQTKNVFAYKMICKDTIEEKILSLQQRKETLAGELIGQEEGFVKSLTEEDVEFLFS